MSFASEFGDSLKCVTVPPDYDGLSDTWVNYGDGMADCWEDSAFNVQDSRAIRPFFTIPPLRFADLDSLPTGRDIDGDYLCNFEEYRGLMVAVDCTDTEAGHRHQRLDPLTKTVVVHVRSNIEDSTRAYMPGFIFNLDTSGFRPQIYFTDSLQWGYSRLADDSSDRRRRTTRWRDFNFNKRGAGRWYVAFALPTNAPIRDTCNAVTFWRYQLSSDWREYLGTDLRRLPYGRMYPSDYAWQIGDTNWAAIPLLTERCVILIDRFNYVRDHELYYRAHPDSFAVDFPAAVRHTIAHEFGHAIGMLHPPDNSTFYSIMNSMRVEADSGRFLSVDPDFSSWSRGQFSIRRGN